MKGEHEPIENSGLGKQSLEAETEAERKVREIDLRLNNSTIFQPKNANQSFYMRIDEFPLKSLIIKRLGWKIKDLSREEQELTMLCFNLLTTECRFPFTFFTNDV
jgi:hypothetical protein